MSPEVLSVVARFISLGLFGARHKPRFRRGNYRILFLALAIPAVMACGIPQERFFGTALTARAPAVAFDLQDQFGSAAQMSEYKGKVVALTFLYTKCTDICPIVADDLKKVHELLGEDARDVAIVAISVDPVGDTVKAVYDYSEKWGMTGKWRYLVGSQEDLGPIWSAYYVAPATTTPAASTSGTAVPPPTQGSVGALREGVGDAYDIVHSAPVYLIDAKGVTRVIHTLPLDPDAVAGDIRLLLKEK